MTSPRKTDRRLREDVARELRWDARVEDARVGVEVRRGIVTLSGTVTSAGMRDAAAECAHRVLGVHDLVNDIRVRQTGDGPDDAEIAAAARHALECDAVVPDHQIQSTVSDGTILLEGEVETGQQRTSAGRALRHLAGVRKVVNRIRVRPVYEVDPALLRRAIEEALERQVQREASRIDLEVEGGLVRIRGHLGSAREERAVVGAVAGTPGVRAVKDELRIEPYPTRAL